MSFPMYQPVLRLKEKVGAKIESGELFVGIESVKTTETRYSTHDGELVQNSSDVLACKIPLQNLRERLLAKHESLGIIRQHPDEYYEKLSLAEIKFQLAQLHEAIDDGLSEDDLRQKLKNLSRQRLLKVWHDHSEIGGHSHILVLVAAVYDSAFYYTPEEIREKGENIDVPTVVEDPDLHILGRSSSSLCDQLQYIKCRRECLLSLRLNKHSLQLTL